MASIRHSMFTLLLIAADAYRYKNTPTDYKIQHSYKIIHWFVFNIVLSRDFLNWTHNSATEGETSVPLVTT